jgi:hypothetical protein
MVMRAFSFIRRVIQQPEKNLEPGDAGCARLSQLRRGGLRPTALLNVEQSRTDNA